MKIRLPFIWQQKIFCKLSANMATLWKSFLLRKFLRKIIEKDLNLCYNKLHFHAVQTASLLGLQQGICLFNYHNKLHCSQTHFTTTLYHGLFNYHNKLHCSQTAVIVSLANPMFNYHNKLHSSQTWGRMHRLRGKFNYHNKLHCSQTNLILVIFLLSFNYHNKLHCSQTIAGG